MLIFPIRNVRRRRNSRLPRIFWRVSIAQPRGRRRRSKPSPVSLAVVDPRGRRAPSAIGSEHLTDPPDFLIGPDKNTADRGIIEEDDYLVLRKALAVRNAVAHGF